MKIKMIRIKNSETSETNEMSVKLFNKKLKKTGGRMGKWSVDGYFEKEVNSFKFIAWVHPKKGGDDYQVEMDIAADRVEDAELELRKYLAKVSDVVNDYELASLFPVK